MASVVTPAPVFFSLRNSSLWVKASDQCISNKEIQISKLSTKNRGFRDWNSPRTFSLEELLWQHLKFFFFFFGLLACWIIAKWHALSTCFEKGHLQWMRQIHLLEWASTPSVPPFAVPMHEAWFDNKLKPSFPGVNEICWILLNGESGTVLNFLEILMYVRILYVDPFNVLFSWIFSSVNFLT